MYYTIGSFYSIDKIDWRTRVINKLKILLQKFVGVFSCSLFR